jgi:hypothetical protein
MQLAISENVSTYRIISSCDRVTIRSLKVIALCIALIYFPATCRQLLIGLFFKSSGGEVLQLFEKSRLGC